MTKRQANKVILRWAAGAVYRQSTLNKACRIKLREWDLDMVLLVKEAGGTIPASWYEEDWSR